MAGEILMATTNPHKKARFEHYLTQLGISVLSFADLADKIEVIEDGKTPEENALKKAMAGFNATSKPTFGVDYWFFIEGISDELQPGPFVRRIFKGQSGERVGATDQEMLEYYSNLIDGIGGIAKGNWVSAVALVTKNGNTFTERFTRETILTSKISPNKTDGEPLNSMQIDPGTGKYFTDLAKDDWLKLQEERELGYVKFFEKHLEDLS